MIECDYLYPGYADTTKRRGVMTNITPLDYPAKLI